MLRRHLRRARGDQSTSAVMTGAPELKMAAKAAGERARARRRSGGGSRRWTEGRAGAAGEVVGAREGACGRGGVVDEVSLSLSCWRDNNRSWGGIDGEIGSVVSRG